ncbi:BRO family protein [Methylomicrobium sp. Wu6]|uniref:BRO family protein n=1 Tax=Methylomicrobium sp. Wu6 TaxID=3107928 RepID=UPI002DD69E36|nr:BRO family protein [Methylomicrobium sp. Wu6]MEC4750040.1 hypothetical protein [Methylomicrobium sp. Wu6]
MNDMTADLSTPMTENDVFHFDESRPSFNDLALQNGFTYWYASDFMSMLGYTSLESFMKVINKAIGTCTTLAIDVMDNFKQEQRLVNGAEIRDCRLSRFACYLVAMNGDVKKVEVARAQVYFASLAEAFKRYVDEAEDVERIMIRDELSIHEKSLSSTAKGAGVDNYGFFQNAGYRGMYNMHLAQLKSLKGIPDGRTPLDFMGKTELAANLFRITQTDLKIQQEGIEGQKPAEAAAFTVGKKVRDTMYELTGVKPENLPIRDDIKKIKGDLKSTHKDFKKLDKKP